MYRRSFAWRVSIAIKNFSVAISGNSNKKTFYFVFDSDLVAELPFILMHPKPEELDPLPIVTERSPGKNATNAAKNDANENASNQAATGNLIQLDG